MAFQRQELRPQLLRNPLIRVERQDPGMGSQPVGVILLIGIVRPFALDDLFGESPGQLERAVRAEAVDDDDLVGDPGQAPQGGLDIGFLVEGDEDRGDLHGLKLSQRID